MFDSGTGLLRVHDSLIWGYIKLKIENTKAICPTYLGIILIIVAAQHKSFIFYYLISCFWNLFSVIFELISLGVPSRPLSCPPSRPHQLMTTPAPPNGGSPELSREHMDVGSAIKVQFLCCIYFLDDSLLWVCKHRKDRNVFRYGMIKSLYKLLKWFVICNL